MSTARVALRLTGVSKSFGGLQALTSVSLEVRAGEVHAVLGENGAGKSTLMGVAAGALRQDAGTVEIGGRELAAASPTEARDLGLAVVYQHPAVLDDLTVAENLALGVPRERRPKLADAGAWASAQLARVGMDLDVARRAEELSPAERQLVEIARALALEPEVLVLDEPTAALNAAEVRNLFERVREIRERGTAVVYISHRIPEVIEIADRLTVLRDGRQRGTFEVDDLDEHRIVNLILGRALGAAFPEKRSAAPGRAVLEVQGLSGEGFDGVTLTVRSGEILGLAGAEGNGQREALRAVAGLVPSEGSVALAGRPLALSGPRRAQDAGIVLVPADRQHEGLFTSLSVGENAAAASLEAYATGGFVRSRLERSRLGAQLSELDVRAPSLDTDVRALSGGNQQKVLLARALLTAPSVLLCDEPTQGVDAGARLEIYRLLRDLAERGTAVVVLSSDAVELQGLCDRVAVFSRGHVVQMLEGLDVTEESITGSVLRATSTRREREHGTGAVRRRRFLRSDFAPGLILLLAILALGGYTAASSSAYLTDINLQSMLFLTAALVLVALGQLTVLLTGGIDLSVGSLTALTVVVLSFRAPEGSSAGSLVLGIGLVLLIGLVVGLVNGLLVKGARISPIISTLAMFILLQGIALLLRPDPAGVFGDSFVTGMQDGIGFVPTVFLVAILASLLCEYALRRSRFGLGIRAVGSDEASAHRLGVPVTATTVGAYVVCSLFTVLGGILLAAQVGIGDATVGLSYTLASVTAVVLGGTSIYGARGAYVCAMLGALFVTQILNATTFLELSQAWEYWLPGGLVLIAAALFARVRGVRVAPLEAGA